MNKAVQRNTLLFVGRHILSGLTGFDTLNPFLVPNIKK